MTLSIHIISYLHVIFPYLHEVCGITNALKKIIFLLQYLFDQQKIVTSIHRIYYTF